MQSAAPLDIATCMFHAGIDPCTKQEAYTAKANGASGTATVLRRDRRPRSASQRLARMVQRRAGSRAPSGVLKK
jgi:hypothetical protein